MPLNFLVDNIAGAITGLFGRSSPTSSEITKQADKTITKGAYDVGTAVYKTVEDVARLGLGFLTKYWYIPVIIGGVIVGYLLIRKNPAANAAAQK